MLVLLVLVRALYVSAVGCRLARRFASRLSLAFTGFCCVRLGVSGCVWVCVCECALSLSLSLSPSPSLALPLPLPLHTLTSIPMENTFSNHMPTGNVSS